MNCRARLLSANLLCTVFRDDLCVVDKICPNQGTLPSYGKEQLPEGCSWELLLSGGVPLAGQQHCKTLSIVWHKSCGVGGPAH